MHILFEKIFQSKENPFTLCNDNNICLKKERPYILVSSTSFTPDEDFGLVLKAIDKIDKNIDRDFYLFITGKGPLKAKYEKEFAERNYLHFKVKFLWLKYEEYACLLGSADLGICVHYSSSGLDLPMKVVDMFGAALPVLAHNFETYCIYKNSRTC